MERSSMASNLKQQSVSGRNMKVISKNKVKNYLWDESSDECYGEAELPGVFSWPPRSYTCSFCKREFRSAQALGGHMNVHRRDRARLRQSPPPREGQYSLLNLNLDPNPNLIFNTNPSFASSSPLSSTSKKCPPFISTSPPLFPTPFSTLSSPPFAAVNEVNIREKDGILHSDHPSSIDADFTKIKSTKRLFELEKLGCNSIMHEKGGTLVNKAEIVRLEMEIGMLGEAKEELDLELRLGYS